MADLEAHGWPPEPIRTERLLLRPTRAADRSGYLELLWSPDVRQFLGGPVGAREDLEREAPEIPGARPGVFAIDHEGTFVGMVQLTRRDADQPGHIRAAGDELEVSFMLRRAYWGHGYAREAVQAVLDWAAALPDDVVLLVSQAGNARSIRLAHRLGFAEAGRFRQFGAGQWLGHRALHRRTDTPLRHP